MSLIVHRCTVCGHPDLFHDPNGNSCSYTQCASGRHEPKLGDPEVLTTWSATSGEEIETVEQPGSTFRGFGQNPVELCGCDACVELYDSLVAARA